MSGAHQGVREEHMSMAGTFDVYNEKDRYPLGKSDPCMEKEHLRLSKVQS